MTTAAEQPVLLAEDDANDVLLVQRAFARAGITSPLKVVRHGEEAVDYLAGNGTYADREANPLPAFLLLDLKLPRLSGFDVLRWAKERAGVQRIPIVVLSSSKSDEDINRAYALGANSYLVKPVAFANLIEMVKSLQAYWLVLNERPDPTA